MQGRCVPRSPKKRAGQIDKLQCMLYNALAVAERQLLSTRTPTLVRAGKLASLQTMGAVIGPQPRPPHPAAPKQSTDAMAGQGTYKCVPIAELPPAAKGLAHNRHPRGDPSPCTQAHGTSSSTAASPPARNKPALKLKRGNVLTAASKGPQTDRVCEGAGAGARAFDLFPCTCTHTHKPPKQ